jgi:uncharacterized membrane protein
VTNPDATDEAVDPDPGTWDGPSGDPVGEDESREPAARQLSGVEENQFLLGISFSDAYRAQEFLTAMTRLQSLGYVRLRDAVMLAKDDDGGVRVRETLDPQPGRSALSGAVWSGLLGLLVGGPVGWLAGMAVGGGVGAVTAKVVDLGVPDEWVNWFRVAVREGTTTVVVLAEDVDLAQLQEEVRRFAGAELVHSTLPTYIIDELETALEEPD